MLHSEKFLRGVCFCASHPNGGPATHTISLLLSQSSGSYTTYVGTTQHVIHDARSNNMLPERRNEFKQLHVTFGTSATLFCGFARRASIASWPSTADMPVSDVAACVPGWHQIEAVAYGFIPALHTLCMGWLHAASCSSRRRMISHYVTRYFDVQIEVCIPGSASSAWLLLLTFNLLFE